MKKLLSLLLVGVILLLSSCSEWGPKKINKNIFDSNNQKIIYLERGTKLIDIDWRVLERNGIIETSAWILTRKMTPSDTAITYEYANGKYTLIIEETK